MSTLNNPGPFDCLKKLDRDEPYFVFRANDPLAPKTVRKWAYDHLQKNGVNKIDKTLEALRVADEMEIWPRRK